MAERRTKVAKDVKGYWQNLFKSAGVPETKGQALLELLADSELSKAFEGDFDNRLRHDEFSRKMDETEKERAKYETLYQQNEQWYKDNIVNGNGNGDAAARAAAAAAAAGAQIDPKNFVSVADYQKAIKEAQNQTLGTSLQIFKEGMKCTSHYARTFNKDLDLDALEAYALKTNQPLKAAYNDFIKDELAAKLEADKQADITKQVNEKVQAELSKHNLPTESAPKEASPFFDRKVPTQGTPPPDERSLMNEFRNSWNEAGAAK
jgi:hypothetical protein